MQTFEALCAAFLGGAVSALGLRLALLWAAEAIAARYEVAPEETTPRRRIGDYTGDYTVH